MRVAPGTGCLSLPAAGGAGFEDALVAETTAERGGRWGDPERFLARIHTEAGGALQDIGARAGGHSMDRSCA